MPSTQKARYPLTARLPTLRLAALALVALALATSCDSGASDATPSGSTAAAARPLVTATDTTLYAVGQGLASQFDLRQLFSAEELAIINRGFNDAVLGTGSFDLVQHLEGMNQMIGQRRAARAERVQAEGDAFVVAEGGKPGATTTESGLVYFETVAGTGATPAVADCVVVHYEGTFPDGRVFDSSLQRGEPTRFPLKGVIPGWQEGLQLMKAGGKARLVIPARLGYGESGFGQAIPPNTPLVFEVELIEVIDN